MIVRVAADALFSPRIMNAMTADPVPAHRTQVEHAKSSLAAEWLRLNPGRDVPSI